MDKLDNTENSLTNKIQLAIGRMQVLKYHSPVCENVGLLSLSIEMDVVSISKSSMVYEFEVKVSRSDFKADAKKRKWEHYDEPSNQRIAPNYFSYVCPKDLIQISEIPKYAGLYYYLDGEILQIRKPKRMHKVECNKREALEKISRITSERHFLGCARLTYENNLIKKRN